MTMGTTEDVIYERCAGIDVHKAKVTVCLRIGRKPEIREFGTMTQDLREMTKWLKESGCQMAAMESTGSYWKPLYNVFELEGLPAMVVNAQHMKNVPGRKTDVKDAEWIAKLLSQGLLKASFIPDREQRELRDLTRFRKSQVEERARNVNRLQKMLEGANIKLGNAVSTVEGKSAKELLDVIISGKDFTVEDVSEHMHGVMKSSPEEIFKSLQGITTPIQRQTLQMVVDIIRVQGEQIDRTDKVIEEYMSDAYKEAAELLTAIPGIGARSAQQIVAEIGIDMSRFPTAGHLCKWAGICPGNNESAGKRLSGRTTHGNPMLKATLVQCATAGKKNEIASMEPNISGLRREEARSERLSLSHTLS